MAMANESLATQSWVETVFWESDYALQRDNMEGSITLPIVLLKGQI